MNRHRFSEEDRKEMFEYLNKFLGIDNTKYTFDEIEKKLNEKQDERVDEMNYFDPDDSILSEIDGYLAFIDEEKKRQKKNMRTAANVSLVARKGPNKLPYDVERMIQENIVEGGKKSRRRNKKHKKTRKHRRTRR